MNDAWSSSIDGGQLPTMMQQPVHQRPPGMTAGRMHNQTWRFAQDKQMFVLKEHREIDLFRKQLFGLGRGNDKRNQLIWPQAISSFHGLAVDQNMRRLDEPVER